MSTVTSLTIVHSLAYFRISMAALFTYDHIINLDSEISLIWVSPWSLAKVLYLLNRYLPFIDVATAIYVPLQTMKVSSESCRASLVHAGWVILVGIAISEVIIGLRTWALWNCSRRLGIILVIVGVGCCVCSSFINTKWSDSLVFYSTDNTPLSHTKCYLRDSSPILAVNFATIIFVETIVVALTLTKMVQQYRSVYYKRIPNGFLGVLYRDGILFFAYMLVISVINLLVVQLSPDWATVSLVAVQRTLHSLLSARVILHLYEARREQVMRDGFSMSTPPDWSTIVSPVTSSHAEV